MHRPLAALSLAALLLSGGASAQTLIDLRAQSTGLPLGATSGMGYALPATCNAGDSYFLLTVGFSPSLKVCVGPNIWQGTGGDSPSQLMRILAQAPPNCQPGETFFLYTPPRPPDNIESDPHQYLCTSPGVWMLANGRDAGFITAWATINVTVPAHGMAEAQVPMPGVAMADAVFLGPPNTVPLGLMWSAYIGAGGENGFVVVRLANLTDVSVDLTGYTWKAAIIREL